MDTKMKEHLVISAFNQAYGKKHPNSSLIVHTDQGNQFTSKNFRMLLKYKKLFTAKVENVILMIMFDEWGVRTISWTS